MIGCGVPAGATNPYHCMASYFGTPASATAGTSGSASRRLGPDTASARTLPESIWGRAVSALANIAAICPLITSVTAGAVPRLGTCCRSIPAILFSSSIDMCGEVPIPGVP